jgi:hypothetical protein
MAYYHICPKCGANLDPGEPCDCEENEEDEFHENDTDKDTHPELQRV